MSEWVNERVSESKIRYFIRQFTHSLIHPFTH
jgi:hypothetical protein